MRIVSLLPSATEIVCALGLRAALVGVSHSCDFPASVAGLPRVTRTAIRADRSSAAIDRQVREALAMQEALYAVDMDLLARLKPDVLVTQGVCAVCAVSGDEVSIAAQRLPRNPVVINLEPASVADVLATIRHVGVATASRVAADALVTALTARIDGVGRCSSRALGPRRPRVALLEWLDPPFTPGHWTPELIEIAGGRCVLGGPGERSRTTSWSEVAAADPDVIVAACCGRDLRAIEADLAGLASHAGWRSLRAVRNGAVTLIDGNHYFSRPGPRLVESAEILGHLLHPAIHPRPREWDEAVLPWRERTGKRAG